MTDHRTPDEIIDDIEETHRRAAGEQLKIVQECVAIATRDQAVTNDWRHYERTEGGFTYSTWARRSDDGELQASQWRKSEAR